MAKTLYDKLWESHVVDTEKDGTTILYIDRHLLHEVTSPQAFEGLRLAGRKPWRDSANLLIMFPPRTGMVPLPIRFRVFRSKRWTTMQKHMA